MPDVKMRTDDQHLLLSQLHPLDAPPQSLVAELCLDGLTASVIVVHNYASGFQDLADFFEQHAHDWRGWEGPSVWNSLQGDLKIEARHEHGHVQLKVTVRKALADWGNDGSAATGDLTAQELAAGDEAWARSQPERLRRDALTADALNNRGRSNDAQLSLAAAREGRDRRGRPSARRSSRRRPARGG